MSNSKEFEDVKLRTSEKAVLNSVNNNGKMPKTSAGINTLSENQNIVRYMLDGKIKNQSMKTNM